MASVATKRRAENKSYKIKHKALKELEKGTPHKDVASLFGVPKNTLSTWKKNKDKIFEKYNSDDAYFNFEKFLVQRKFLVQLA